MTKENLNMNPEELTQKAILYLEEAILVVISESKDVKCIRLFRPQFRKVKIRFVVEIP